MGVEVVTIFPEVVLHKEQCKTEKETSQNRLLDDFYLCGSHVISYKKFISSPRKFSEKVRNCVLSTQTRLVDRSGAHLQNFTIIVDQDVVWEGAAPPSPEGYQLFLYLLNLNDIHSRLDLHVLKTGFLPSGDTSTYLNDLKVLPDSVRSLILHFERITPFVIPIEQDTIRFLSLGLSQLRKNSLEQYERVLNGISLFNESCRTRVFHREASVVLLVSALEALFSMPSTDNRKVFSYMIQVFWGFNSDIERWASELFDLRSAVVHGGVVGEHKFKLTPNRFYAHYEIGKKVFNDCLKFALEMYGAMGLEWTQKLAARKQILSFVTSNRKKIEGILRKKLTYDSLLRNYRQHEQFLDILDTLDEYDDSAKQHLVPFLKLVFAIAWDWMKEEKERVQHMPMSNTLMRLTQKLDNYDRILQVIERIRKLDGWNSDRLSPKTKPVLRKLLPEVIKEARQLEDIYWYDRFPDTPTREVEEFLIRCLQAAEKIYRFG